MVMVPIYRYTVWRNSDDKLLALDVLAEEAARIMGMSRMSLDHLMYISDGRNGTWTVTKKRINEIEAEMCEGIDADESDVPVPRLHRSDGDLPCVLL